MGQTWEIRNAADGRMMGTVDGVRASLECHLGAIYLHGGRSYLIQAFDPEKRLIHAEPAFDADYFTVPLTDKQTEILETLERTAHPGFRAGLGRLLVTTFFRGYLRRRLTDQETISEHTLDLPPFSFETVGMWVEVPPAAQERIIAEGGHFMGGLHASEHAAIGLFPLLALCDRGDLGGISYPHHAQIGGPAFFIYDGLAGGIGLARQGHARVVELLERTGDLIASCRCEDGCPSCVQSPRCGNGNRPLDRSAATLLLRLLTGAEPLPAAAEEKGTMPLPAREPPRAAPGRIDPARVPAAPVARAAKPDLFFDLETLRSAEEVGGWHQAARMGLALGVVFDRGRDEWRVYTEERARDLIIDLMSASRVVGFNVRRFDYEVLKGYAAADFTRVPTLDLLEDIHRILGFRLSLAHLAETTLGVAKAGDGLLSLQWVREGRWDLIEAYCRRDVEITARLFDFGRQNGHLLFRDRGGQRVRLPVSWD
jgi:DEAD/DEAH box helicase domain-containing protein